MLVAAAANSGSPIINKKKMARCQCAFISFSKSVCIDRVRQSQAGIMLWHAAVISDEVPIMPIMLLCMNIMPIKASTASAPIIAKMISITFNIGEAVFMISPLCGGFANC
jgi:hypothetical protein